MLSVFAMPSQSSAQSIAPSQAHKTTTFSLFSIPQHGGNGGFNPHDPKYKIVAVVQVKNVNEALGTHKTIAPEWWCVVNCEYITNVQDTGGQEYLNFPITTNVTPAPYAQNLNLSFTAQVSGSYTANVNLSAGIVSGGAGWNVTATLSATVGDTVIVPPYSCTVYLGAYATLEMYSFDVYFNPYTGNAYQVGNGWIYKPTGTISFFTWTQC